MSGWQDIETAPKDGTNILLFVPYGNQVLISRWTRFSQMQGQWAWSDFKTGPLPYDPTHWMPLPPPPGGGGET